MNRFVISIVLTCALSGIASAGQIPSVPAPQPSPAPAASDPMGGDTPSDGIARELSTDALSTLISALTFLTV
jgi:hypothetical protein